MGFASGAVSCRRFVVEGRQRFTPSEALLEQLSAQMLRPTELGVPGEVEYGWSGGRHLLDMSLSFEHNVFGDWLLLAMRVDTHAAPAELRRAYFAIEEEAARAETASGQLSRARRQEIRDAVTRKLEDELRDGRHRRSRLLPVLWDTSSGMLYCNAQGTNVERLTELFERTFDSRLEPLTAGALARRHLQSLGRTRDYEDLRPTRFALGPGGESQAAEYPWAAKGPEPKDFLGNEFLLWLWHAVETQGGFELPDRTDVAVFFDRVLDLDCVFGQTGRDVLRGDGPTRMPEARDALRTGKVPRRAGLVIDVRGETFSLTLAAETLSLAAVRLPESNERNGAAFAEEASGSDFAGGESAGGEPFDHPREVFERRLELLSTLWATLDRGYESFLKLRSSGAWEAFAGDCRKWIAGSAVAGAWTPPRPKVELPGLGRRGIREPVAPHRQADGRDR